MWRSLRLNYFAVARKATKAEQPPAILHSRPPDTPPTGDTKRYHDTKVQIGALTNSVLRRKRPSAAVEVVFMTTGRRRRRRRRRVALLVGVGFALSIRIRTVIISNRQLSFARFARSIFRGLRSCLLILSGQLFLFSLFVEIRWLFVDFRASFPLFRYLVSFSRYSLSCFPYPSDNQLFLSPYVSVPRLGHPCL